MQDWLDNINILMYSTHNKGKPVVAETFPKTLKPKMIANDSKSYLSHFNKLVDQYCNTYHYTYYTYHYSSGTWYQPFQIWQLCCSLLTVLLR